MLRIVVHGSEQTLWEPPISEDGEAVLKITEPKTAAGMLESVHITFDPICSSEQAAGITDSVKAFINDEAIL